MKLWLDDRRPAPDETWTHITTAARAIDYVRRGIVERVSFDYDLGGGGTGYTVACAIEQEVVDGCIACPAWSVHSANPVGAERIREAMRSAEHMATAWHHLEND